MSLASLKKNSSAALEKLKAVATEANAGRSNSNQDDRLWRPVFDKETGVGSAVIRFMPAVEGQDLPWSKLIRHAFKGETGKWYIENSLNTIGKTDPVQQLNSRLWNSGVESDRLISKAQKRKTEYFANVFIVKDPANPENEGKVMIYRFGPMIYEMIQNAMFPKFEGDESLDPFNPWHGANFNIRMVGKKIGNDIVPNYEKSSFGQPCALLDGDDDAIEAAYAKCYDLSEFVSEDKFKTYDELAKRLVEVLGTEVGSGVEVVEGWAAATPRDYDNTQQRAASSQSQDAPANDSAPAGVPDTEGSFTATDDEDDEEAFLRNLLKEG